MFKLAFNTEQQRCALFQSSKGPYLWAPVMPRSHFVGATHSCVSLESQKKKRVCPTNAAYLFSPTLSDRHRKASEIVLTRHTIEIHSDFHPTYPILSRRQKFELHLTRALLEKKTCR